MTDSEAILEPTEASAFEGEIVIKGPEFKIGRGLENNYTIKDVNISRQHCVFSYDENQWTLKDLSTNGTFINGVQIGQSNAIALSSGDIVSFSSQFKAVFKCRDNSACKRAKRDESSETLGISKDSSVLPVSPSSPALRKHRKSRKDIAENDMNLLDLNLKLEEYKCAGEKLIKEKEELLAEVERDKLAVEKKNQLVFDQLNEENASLQKFLMKEMKEKALLEAKLKCHVRDPGSLDNKKKREIQALRSQLLHEKSKQLSTVLEEVKMCLVAKQVEIGEVLPKASTSQDQDDGVDELLKRIKTLEHEKLIVDNILADSSMSVDAEDASKSPSQEDSNKSSENSKDDFKCWILSTMEDELQCSICNEIFVVATSLNCSHTFCKSCILKWRKRKNVCPVCRTNVSTLTNHLALDSFISKVLSTFSEEEKQRRAELVAERTVHNANNDIATILEISSDDDDEDDDESWYNDDIEDELDDDDDMEVGPLLRRDNVLLLHHSSRRRLQWLQMRRPRPGGSSRHQEVATRVRP